VDNLHANAVTALGQLTNVFLERILHHARSPGVQTRTEWLEPRRRLLRDYAGVAGNGAVLQISKPLALKKRHVAAHNQAPCMLVISRARVHQGGEDTAKRPLAWPAIVHDALANI